MVDNTGLQYIDDIGKPTELMLPFPFNPFMIKDHAEEKMLASFSLDNEVSIDVQQHDLSAVDDEDDEEVPQVVEEDDTNKHRHN